MEEEEVITKPNIIDDEESEYSNLSLSEFKDYLKKRLILAKEYNDSEENNSNKTLISTIIDQIKDEISEEEEDVEIIHTNEVEKDELKSINLSLDDKVENNIQISCPNLGNSCYINSVLQLFFHSKRLYSELREIIELENGGNIVELISKVRNMYTSEKKLSIGEQCDSYLFFSFLLDKINELFPSKFNPCYSILLHSKIKCTGCKNIVHQRQCENILYLRPSPLINDIDDMINLEFKVKNLDYKCKKCDSFISSKKTIIENLPEYLFITLQEFGEENIDFKIEKNLVIEGLEYELTGMIEHIGVSNNGGHYVSYIKHSNKIWYLYNDDRITEFDDIKTIRKQDKRQYCQVLLVWYKIYRTE
jgi:uncharacterized UBP type Zn finger protein